MMGANFIGTHFIKHCLINNTANEHILILSVSSGGTDTQSLLIIDNILICKHLDRQDKYHSHQFHELKVCKYSLG